MTQTNGNLEIYPKVSLKIEYTFQINIKIWFFNVQILSNDYKLWRNIQMKE